MEKDTVVKERIATILLLLDERQSRIYLAAEAKSIGWGGKSKIAQLSHTSRKTIAKGQQEPQGQELTNRIRKAGGGRKKIIDKNPEILLKIKDLVAPHTMGDPMNPLIWTSKSVRKITAELVALKYKVCHEVVRQSLKSLGFSLQANKKTDEGSTNEDRNAQFDYINHLAISFMEQGNPVISRGRPCGRL